MPQDSTTPPRLRAFVDESFLESDRGGFYVLAAVVFEPDAHEAATYAMVGLRAGRSTSKLHWNEMDRLQKRAATLAVAQQGGFHVVAVGAPVPRRRQERARVRCLQLLVHELHGYGVTELVMESRTKALDARDVATVIGARHNLSKGTAFRVEHQAGAEQPLLWAADIVAGAVRSHRQLGDSVCRDLLGNCLYEIDVDTDC
ncbi:hypothetical protein [Actinokineospora sp.]|uniref:hypothetical protein n=1 Tax=Actinokineospora sp. TaxID=1872133 RepID=UPI004037D7D7